MTSYQETSKARRRVPLLQFLAPFDKAFKENIKQVHFQAMVWHTTMKAEPRAVDPTDYV